MENQSKELSTDTPESPLPALENNFNTTREPWVTRAATFCDDGTPSFEVVMPDGPYMNACDARLIGAAPVMLRLLRTALDHLEERNVHISAGTPDPDWATERAMTAAYIRNELETAMRPPITQPTSATGDHVAAPEK